MIDRATRGALNQREVDMDFCDKSHKMNSPELRIKNSQLKRPDIEMKKKLFHKTCFVKKQELQHRSGNKDKTSLSVSIGVFVSIWFVDGV